MNLLKFFSKALQIEKGVHILKIHSDYGREIENANFALLCDEQCIYQEIFAPIIPQQNKVVEE